MTDCKERAGRWEPGGSVGWGGLTGGKRAKLHEEEVGGRVEILEVGEGQDIVQGI